MHTIAALRKEYSKASLDIATIDKDPIRQFERWLQEAIQAAVPEPTAMHLATTDESGKPSSRVVLLKGVEENSFVFFTNYQSKKGRELDKNPACALSIYWSELERQVCIGGIAHRLDTEKSLAYFQSRPRGSQVGAWASPQSSVIQSREILEERVAQLDKQYAGLSVLPKPHQWGGYKIIPYLIEFWQGRPSRLHDRIECVLIDGTWKMNRLAP